MPTKFQKPNTPKKYDYAERINVIQSKKISQRQKLYNDFIESRQKILTSYDNWLNNTLISFNQNLEKISMLITYKSKINELFLLQEKAVQYIYYVFLVNKKIIEYKESCFSICQDIFANESIEFKNILHLFQFVLIELNHQKTFEEFVARSCLEFQYSKMLAEYEHYSNMMSLIYIFQHVELIKKSTQLIYQNSLATKEDVFKKECDEVENWDLIEPIDLSNEPFDLTHKGKFKC